MLPLPPFSPIGGLFRAPNADDEGSRYPTVGRSLGVVVLLHGILDAHHPSRRFQQHCYY
jgi:hypothetical protein